MHTGDASEEHRTLSLCVKLRHTSQNPISFTEPMVVVVLRALHDLCRSEIERELKEILRSP